MSDLLGRIIGGRHDPAAEAAEAQRERDLARARRWPQFQPEQLQPLDDNPGWLVADGDRIVELMPPASDPEMHYVVGWVMVDDTPRYLRPPLNGPSSLAMWQHRRDIARREADQSRRDEAKRLASTPLRLLTADLIEGPLPTPRQAFETFTRLHGELWVDADGRLQAGWREAAAMDSYGRPALLDAAKVLFRCEQLVVEHLQNGTPLPDSPITPAGAVAVPKPPTAQRRAS